MKQPHRLGLRALGWLVGAAGLWPCFPAARAEDDRLVDEQPAATTPGQQLVRLDLGMRFEQQVRRDLLGDGIPRGDGPSPVVGGSDSSLSGMLPALERIGESRLARIDSICDPTPIQRRRLQLAVQSDIRRLVGDIEAARKKYAGTIVEIDRRRPASQRPVAEFQQTMEGLVQRRRALLGSDSMLAKTLPTTLDADQLARLSADTAARRARRWQSIVAGLLDGIDAWLGLDQRQYDEIERLLLERQPPLRVDVAVAGNVAQQQQAEQILAAVVLAEVDVQRLQAALSERQWKTFAPWRGQGAARRSYVVNLGILEQVPQ